MDKAFLLVNKMSEVFGFGLHKLKFGHLLLNVNTFEVLHSNDDSIMWDEGKADLTSVCGGILFCYTSLEAVDLRLTGLGEGGSETNVLDSLSIDIINSKLKDLNSNMIPDRNTFEIPVSDNDTPVVGNDRTLADGVTIAGSILSKKLIVDSDVGDTAVLLTWYDIEAELLVYISTIHI